MLLCNNKAFIVLFCACCSCSCNFLCQWDMARAVPRKVNEVKLFTGDIQGLCTGRNKVFACTSKGAIRYCSSPIRFLFSFVSYIHNGLVITSELYASGLPVLVCTLNEIIRCWFLLLMQQKPVAVPLLESDWCVKLHHTCVVGMTKKAVGTILLHCHQKADDANLHVLICMDTMVLLSRVM